MADVAECVGKLVAVGAISRAIGDQALDMFRRSKAEYSKAMGPASSDAAAALQAAKALRETAAKKQLAIAASVKTWRDTERRIIDDPRGGMLGLVGMLSKDTMIGDNRLAGLRRDNPEHPILRGGSVDANRQVLRTGFYNMLGPEIDKFKGKGAASASDLIYEIKGVDTGNKAAKAVAAGWQSMVKAGEQRALMTGVQFDQNLHWDTPQDWQSRRVAKFSQDEFVKDWHGVIDSGGVKLIDKGQPPSAATLFEPARTGFYATPDRVDDILKKAYADIKYEGGQAAPFSEHMRTFEFQHNKAGADAWLKMQAKYGTGNEIMSIVDQHIDHMASTIALHEMFGPQPQAAFEAAVRLAKEKNPAEALSPGLRWFDSETVARNTFAEVAGTRGYSAGNIGNEVWARRMAGARQLVGAAALRNLPISIVPSDIAMSFLAAHHDGMSGLNVISHTLQGGMTRQEAAHLQIAAHSYQDFVQNSYRRYEDEINASGLARAVPNFVVKATGANWWTNNIRLGYQLSYFHQLADMADRPWSALDPRVRDNFLSHYGVTENEWDQIRNIPPDLAPNGAKYINLPELTRTNRELSERLQRAVGERSSYGAHQPDARTRAIATGGAVPGTFAGETRLAMVQYKQFALERMSTHLMRVLYEGTVGDRIMRGLAFTLLSTAAGAISLQTAEILAGKNPHDMSDPAFWTRAFAKGGAGGVFGDLLAEALNPETRSQAGFGFIGGPVGGVLGDVGRTALSPLRHDLFDAGGRRVTSGPWNDTFQTLRRWTPETWYTKLAVDRLFYDQLQTLLDPHYRESFRRAEQYASRRGGGGYWWAPGEAAPSALQ
jgi:hypothetical protein